MIEQAATKKRGRRDILLTIARSAISEALGLSLNGFIPFQADWLQKKTACFVTLKMNGKLRGCIGSLKAYRSLDEDLYANAIAAALHDPRFPPLTAEELDKVKIEVSLLSPMRRLKVSSESEAVAALEPGRHGVVFQYGEHHATFLPQVWEQLPDARQFLAQLRFKAGLAPDFWHPDVLVYTYRVERFSEDEELE